jgi:hypothetical protein
MSIQSAQRPDIRRDLERVSADVVKKAALFQAAILADVAGRREASRFWHAFFSQRREIESYSPPIWRLHP